MAVSRNKSITDSYYNAEFNIKQTQNHAALPPTLGTVVVTRWYNDARKIKQILISKWHEIGGDD